MNLLSGQKVKKQGHRAHTVNAHYLPNGKAYQFQTWYRRSTKTSVSDKPRDLQGQRSRCKVTWRVWQVWPISREWNTKIGGKVVHLTCNSAHQFQVQRSKVKVTRPTNAETESASYLPNGKAYELQTWYTDGTRRPASPKSAVISTVKGQGRKVTWRVWQVLADNVLETPKLMGRLSTLQVIMRTSFKFKDQRSRSPGRLMLRPKVRHILWTGRPTNFKLGNYRRAGDIVSATSATAT